MMEAQKMRDRKIIARYDDIGIRGGYGLGERHQGRQRMIGVGVLNCAGFSQRMKWRADGLDPTSCIGQPYR